MSDYILYVPEYYDKVKRSYAYSQPYGFETFSKLLEFIKERNTLERIYDETKGRWDYRQDIETFLIVYCVELQK